MAATQKPVIMRGPTTWAPHSCIERGQIATAYLHDNKTLVINLEDANYSYGVKLERSDGDLFQGEWTCIDKGVTSTGAASARLYHSQNRDFLFGEWTGTSQRFYWWAELCIMKDFPDEGNE